jgi:hypothetical protein
MSYTPPAGDEADLQFAGTYVPFAGDRADLTFEELAAGVTRAQGISPATHFGSPRVLVVATGWLATHFGTPFTKVFTYASGFTSTTFGAPRWGVNTQHTSAAPSTAFGTAAIEPHVMPIHSTVFGTPNSPYLQTGVATGFLTTQLGPDPRLMTVGYALSSPPSTVVSTAYTATDQTAEASGTAFTKFGTPFYGTPPEIIINWRCVARGWEDHELRHTARTAHRRDPGDWVPLDPVGLAEGLLARPLLQARYAPRDPGAAHHRLDEHCVRRTARGVRRGADLRHGLRHSRRQGRASGPASRSAHALREPGQLHRRAHRVRHPARALRSAVSVQRAQPWRDRLDLDGARRARYAVDPQGHPHPAAEQDGYAPMLRRNTTC